MKVAVEANLSPVSEYLSQQGLQVETLDASTIEHLSENSDYAAIIISGADKNMMGIQDVQTNCPVINALGLSPEEVHRRIQSEPTIH